MAKKKPRPEGANPRRRKRPRRKTDPLANLPDRRTMEGLMQQLMVGRAGEAPPDTPIARAQEVMHRAFQETSPRRREELARQALEISPDCADAYVLLAEQSHDRKETRELYEQGVAAGERALGQAMFREGAGHFWGILETRPYMRARLGLALSLWTMGRREEAVRHLEEMLRLNPNDNQGVRYTLAGFLLALDRDDDLARLLDQYPGEGLAAWKYTRALLAFRRHGDTSESRALLKAALKANKHVPAYLLGEKFPPLEQPGYYGIGDENEAVVYIRSFLTGWKSTPGALPWLRDTLSPARKKPAARRPTGPLPAVKKWLRSKLTQEPDVWQAGLGRLPQWLLSGGRKVRPWIVLVVNRTDDLVLAHALVEEEPAGSLLWDNLVEAMRAPAVGEPHRPAEIQVRPGGPWDALRPHLEEVGIRLVPTDALDVLDDAFAGLTEHLAGKREPGLLDVPGVTADKAAGFYDAAASYYRKAPWRKVGYEAAVRVECDKLRSGPWYAVPMGQSGLTLGLAVYEDLDLLRRMWAGNLSDEENARRSVATSVIFGEEADIPVADSEAARRHGWPVAGPEAYPVVFHKERGMAVRPPLAWELEMLEACLRAVPDFIDRHPQDDPARDEMTVPTSAGPLRLVLSWADGEAV